MKHHLFWFVLLGLAGWTMAVEAGDTIPVRIATFQVDATPPLGSPLCDGLVQRAKEITDPLSARGIILLTEQKPIVLCSFDWVGIGNTGNDAFREALARGAGTSVDRVCVHSIHQHDAPGCDFAAEEFLASEGLAGEMFDAKFARKIAERLTAAAQKAIKEAQPVTHVGLGAGTVEKVASNRRLLGPDGKVAIGRMSSCRNPKAIEAPEGVIDPQVRLVTFWNGEQPLASLTFYAVHPMSYYAQGKVSADFVGLARKLRESAVPKAAHIHFNGAGGNVAAGKYNDGSPGMRPLLAQRLATGMAEAWKSQQKMPITAADVGWTYKTVQLPLRDRLQNDKALLEQVRDSKRPMRERVRAGRDLVYARLVKNGRTVNINCLKLGSARVLFMPGELFIEYQLAAQKMLPDHFVALAAYGDYGPGYIGTAISYGQGGYETGVVSRTAPQVEQVLMGAMRELLQGE